MTIWKGNRPIQNAYLGKQFIIYLEIPLELTENKLKSNESNNFVMYFG